MSLCKVVSGGQTGVDRAALDAALACEIPLGGWCPRGRLAEDGTIPAKFPLVETESDDYAERTMLNVRDSDGTLIISPGATLSGGTLYTSQCAEQLKKPLLLISLDARRTIEETCDWIGSQQIGILNVAGPRASQAPAIYAEAYNYLVLVFHEIKKRQARGNR